MTDRDSILSLTVTGKPLYQAIRDSMTEVTALHGFQFDHTSLGREEIQEHLAYLIAAELFLRHMLFLQSNKKRSQFQER